MREIPPYIQVYREREFWKAICKNCGVCFATGTSRALLVMATGDHACDPKDKALVSRSG